MLTKIPTFQDFRIWSGDIKNQGSTGSCTAQDLVNCSELMAARVGENIKLSALFNYYESRSTFYGAIVDNGSTTENALKAAMDGVAKESLWAFNEDNVNVKPSDDAYQDAHNFKILSYETLKLDPDSQIARESTIKTALVNYPVLFETNVNYKFAYEDRVLGQQIWNKPGVSNQYDSYGRHSVAIEGYGVNGTLGSLFAENSWGKEWGDNGFGLVNSSYESDKAYIITGFQINGKTYDFSITEHKVQVNSLYAALFDRAADAEGLHYWSDLLNAGQSMQTIASSMLNCEPAKAVYPDSTDNKTFVDHIYVNALGRNADAEGLKFWESKLNHGENKWELITELINIVEHYNGNDAAGIMSQAFFTNRVEVSIYNSIFCNNNNISLCNQVLDHVTSDVDSVPTTQMWLAGQLQEHGWI